MNINLEGFMVPFRDWVAKSREVAHKPENHIDTREPRQVVKKKLRQLRSELRFKYREPDWPSALTFHYSVEILPNGDVIRHLTIQQSIECTTMDARELRGQVKEYRSDFLVLLTPLVGEVFPLNEDVASNVTTYDPVPIRHADTGQVTARVVIAYDFAVPFDRAPVLGLLRRDTNGLGRLALVGADGKPLVSGGPRFSGNVATDGAVDIDRAGMKDEDDD